MQQAAQHLLSSEHPSCVNGGREGTVPPASPIEPVFPCEGTPLLVLPSFSPSLPSSSSFSISFLLQHPSAAGLPHSAPAAFFRESPDTTTMTLSPLKNSLEMTLSLLMGLPFLPAGCSVHSSLTFSRILHRRGMVGGEGQQGVREAQRKAHFRDSQTACCHSEPLL